MEERDLLAELEARSSPERWDDRAPFRETFLSQLADPAQRADLRSFGLLLAFLVAEAPGPASTPAAGWRAGLAAALADLCFIGGHLASLSRDFLATEPAGSARHREARAAGLLALELARTAERLAALKPGRRQPTRKTRQAAPEAAA